ncbi:MAG: ABC transporter permease subunit [Clostridia bacterium]|nr:ABC transporter permease subunit [Clostridia bacterium]
MKAFYRWLSQSRIGKALTGIVAVLFWLLIWHIAAARLAKPLLLPSPAMVAFRLGELCATSVFWQYSLRSLLRVMAGIAGGAVMAIIVAALTAAIAPIDLLLRPLITVIKTTPVASFIILALLWLDEGILPIFISFLMVFPVIWANLHTALSSVPTAYRELSQVYRLPLARRIRRIYAPHALPHFLSACRSSMGLAWKAGIAAEAIALPALSIGKQLMESKIYLETIDLFAWTTMVILLSLVLEAVTSLIFRRLQAHSDCTTTAKCAGEEDAVCLS